MSDWSSDVCSSDLTIESDRAYASGPRLARYLKRLIRKDVETSHRVELSQTELGNFAGMSREHINRQLRAWEESGVIALEQGRVRVLDPEMLEDNSEDEGWGAAMGGELLGTPDQEIGRE